MFIFISGLHSLFFFSLQFKFLQILAMFNMIAFHEESFLET